MYVRLLYVNIHTYLCTYVCMYKELTRLWIVDYVVIRIEDLHSQLAHNNTSSTCIHTYKQTNFTKCLGE